MSADFIFLLLSETKVDSWTIIDTFSISGDNYGCIVFFDETQKYYYFTYYQYSGGAYCTPEVVELYNVYDSTIGQIFREED